MYKKSCAASAILLILAGPAYAEGDTLADQLTACARENMDAARLACYDAIARVPGGLQAPSTPPEPTPAPAPTPTATAAAPVVAATSATTMGVDPVAEFGKEDEKDDEREVREISAMATAVKKRPAGQLMVTLDNGQVWTEKDHEAHFRIRVGDVVRIKKGRFGGFTMINADRRSSAVRRIE
ncbi:MAG: hypothetical protein AAF351_00090 [Pseudomonadota bacterium]